LEFILQEYCPEVEVLALCSSAVEGRKAIMNLHPDLVFLDIEMPGGSGFDMLKPIDILELSQAVEKVKNRLAEKSENLRMKTLLVNRQTETINPKIALPLSDKIEFVEISTIIRCEGEGNYAHIYLKSG
jgi:two-component system LytT family response regulator